MGNPRPPSRGRAAPLVVRAARIPGGNVAAGLHIGLLTPTIRRRLCLSEEGGSEIATGLLGDDLLGGYDV